MIFAVNLKYWQKKWRPYLRAKRGFEESELFYYGELEINKI